MPKQSLLRPLDVAVALRLSREPGSTFETIADDLEMSVSVAHGAVTRLRHAGLVQPASRKVNRHALLEFLEHGVKYAFPASRGGSARGVPTAHSAPALASQLVSEDVIVWSSAKGSTLGESLTPLYERAPSLALKSPPEYEMLTLVDAIRIGGARERSLALDALRDRIYHPPGCVSPATDPLLGFRRDTSATHAHRWIAPDGDKLDLVPFGQHLGASGSALDRVAAATAVATELEPGLTIRHVSAPAFIAMKLAAHKDRFADDPFASRDLQDVFAVIASRPEIVEEMKLAPVEIRSFAAGELQKLLAHPDVDEMAAAHLNDARPLAPVVEWTLAGVRRMAEF